MFSVCQDTDKGRQLGPLLLISEFSFQHHGDPLEVPNLSNLLIVKNQVSGLGQRTKQVPQQRMLEISRSIYTLLIGLDEPHVLIHRNF